jgi:hypothetical protein
VDWVPRRNGDPLPRVEHGALEVALSASGSPELPTADCSARNPRWFCCIVSSGTGDGASVVRSFQSHRPHAGLICTPLAISLHCAHLGAIAAREGSKGGVKTMRTVNADLVFAASWRAF